MQDRGSRLQWAPISEVHEIYLLGISVTVEEARVYFIEGPVPLPDIAALTDRSGRFALSAPVSGTYQLGFASEGPAGFVQQTTTVEVGEEQGIDLEVRLDE